MGELPPLETWQWAALFCAAFCTGLSKTGLSGVGIVSVALFPLLLPPRLAVGGALILFLFSDLIAVSFYRRHGEWKHLLRLFPWAAIGIVTGYFSARHIADGPLKHLIGAILLGIGVLSLVQKIRDARQSKTASTETDETQATSPSPLLVSALIGIFAGFTTMVANAAGPIMVLYLLSMRLPKTAFVGTAAWFFMGVNTLKLPFGIALGGVNPHTLRLALTLFPAALAGGIMGRLVLKRIPQATFEMIALVLTLIAGVKLAWPF